MTPIKVPPEWFPPPESPPPPLDTTKPSGKFTGFIDELGKRFSQRLGSWVGTAIGAGIDAFMRVLGKSFAPKLKPLLDKLEEAGAIPPELKLMWDEMKAPTGEVGAVLGAIGASSSMGSAVGRLVAPLFEPLSRFANTAFPFTQVDVAVILEYYLRHPEWYKHFVDRLRGYGFSKEEEDILLELKHPIFPSEVVGPAWLRDKAKYEKYWDDVKHLGVTDDRIELLKELAYQMPSVRDVVGFLAHEVFEPKMIAKYGLDDEWGELDKTLFEKVGLKEPMALNYWRDHWTHASWSQVMEMLHRGAISEQDVYDWFRLVEIPPYWRTNLTKIMYNLPGRIEIRMMAQYGLVGKEKVMELLRADGLAEKYVPLVADMNIVRGVRTDLQTRYIKKWIDSEGVKAEIAKLNLTPPMPDRLYQWIVTNAKPDRTAAEKDLTVSQVTKAVKRGDISWNDGIDRLIDQGYDEDEADLIMVQNVEVIEAEPTTELNVRVDTIRRQRRQRLITRDQEIASLLDLGLDTGLATAYADNDDLRLVKETTGGA